MAPGTGPKEYVISPYVVERSGRFSFDRSRWFVAPALSGLLVVMIAGAVHLGNGLADRLLLPRLTAPDTATATDPAMSLARMATPVALSPDRMTATPSDTMDADPSDADEDLASSAMRDLLIALAPIPRPRPESLNSAGQFEGLAGAELDPLDTSSSAPPILRVEAGDTLMHLLTSAGVAQEDAVAAVTALKPSFKPKQLQPGQEIRLDIDTDAAAPRLNGLTIKAAVDLDIALTRNAKGDYAVEEIARPLAQKAVRAEGRIESSLYKAGADAGVPDAVLANLIQVFSFDVDFQRDIHPGDSFSMLFESFSDENGRIVRNGDILVAELTFGGKSRRLYRHVDTDGGVDYYDAKGQSARRALLKTPIDGARVTSGYGMRRHPILGYSRMHRGIDFAAPTGTPVFAAGTGVIEMAGWNAGYGRYIRIRHDGAYDTAYAHLHGFARGIGKGRRVRQGQIIGYVGTTGQSTGPHLHYEVMRNNAQVDPQGVKLPTGRSLAGSDLKSFLATVKQLEKQHAEAAPKNKLAAAGSGSTRTR